jgi:hypothetical protein
MTISINKIVTDNRFYAPRVSESGPSLSVDAASFQYGKDGGNAESTSVAFGPSDANKSFDLSLVRQKNDGSLRFYLLVQAPEVLAPLVPELNTSIDVLFHVLTGKVSQDGASLSVLVRHFVSGK